MSFGSGRTSYWDGSTDSITQPSAKASRISVADTRRGKPGLVIAFPGGNGTADMVKKAKQAGLEVVMVSKEGTDAT